MDADQRILESSDHLIDGNAKKISGQLSYFDIYLRELLITELAMKDEANIKRSFCKFISIIIGLKTDSYSFNENSSPNQWKPEWTKANNNIIGEFITMKPKSVTAIASTCQHVTHVTTVLLTRN